MIFLLSKAVSVSAMLILLGTGGPALAQENATKFIQGNQTYEARVIPERFALVLSDEALENEESYNSFRDKLKGKQIPGQSPRILVIAASNNQNAASLAEQARQLQRSNAGVVQDSGFLVLLGSADTPSVVTDRIVVKLAPGMDINKIVEEQQIELVASDPFDESQFVLKVPSKNSRDSLSISNDINLIPGVAYAKPDFYSPVRPRQVPNDPLFGKQWHLENMGASGGTMDADIDGDRAWQLGSGGHPGVVIAVIDGGIAVDHPDLDHNIRVNTAEYPPDKKDSDRNKLVDDYIGWDFIPCNTSSFPCGDNNVRPNFHEKHGTPVAGAAAAETDNLVGVAGVCGDCRILPIRALDASDFALAKAFDYARTSGADVITASWGLVPGYPLPLDLVNAINMAAEKGRNGLGAVVLFAMTDTPTENCSGMFPDISSLPKVIAVSASTNEDRIAGTGYGSCMDVLAPTAGGTLGAASTDFPGVYGYNNRSPDVLCMTPELSTQQLDYTVCFNGTSFATPVVAGLAGLILTHQPLLRRVQVQRLLQDTADKISPTAGAYIAETGFSAQTTQPAPTHGFGRVNAFEAVRTVASSISGGREGIDIYLRDNRLDWGNTEQPSNITLEQVRGFIPHWESPDIKVDAPPYSTPPVTATDFASMADEQPLANSVNRVFVRVHNRGPCDASGVTVKLHWAFAGAGLPNVSNNDFWPVFPADAADVSAWHPIASQVLPSVPYSGASVAGGAWDESKIVQFEFNAPGLDTSRSSPDLFTLLAILDAPADPISSASRGSLVPDVFTPRDNNIAQKQIRLVDGGQMVSQTILLTNPFSYPIRTRLVADAPEVEAGDGNAVDLKPGETRSIDVIVRGGGAAGRSIDLMQLYESPGSSQEQLLGGRSYQIEPARSPRDAERHDPMDRR